jgi:ribosomal protein S18 acetylase RimI-like enzyme
MNALRIRRYEERDFRAYVGTLEKTTNWGDEAEEELAARIQKMTEKDEIWVAEVDAQTVGFMILTPNDDGTLEIDWLDAHPDFQRKGVATGLVAKAAEIAVAKSIEVLSIHTSVENKNMITFLKRNGFEVLERLADFYGKGKDALRYKKS